MAQAALGNEALVLLIVLQKRDVITGALFDVQCASVILKVKVKSKVVAETVTLLFPEHTMSANLVMPRR